MAFSEVMNVNFCWLAITWGSICRSPMGRISVMSSSWRPQQCSACFACLSGIVCEIGAKWLFCGMLLPDFFQYSMQHSCKVSIQVFLQGFVRIQEMQLYNSTYTDSGWKNPHFTPYERSDVHKVIILFRH